MCNTYTQIEKIKEWIKQMGLVYNSILYCYDNINIEHYIIQHRK